MPAGLGRCYRLAVVLTLAAGQLCLVEGFRARRRASALALVITPAGRAPLQQLRTWPGGPLKQACPRVLQ